MFQKVSGMENSLWVRGGGIAIFRREILSHSAEKLRVEPSFNDIEILEYRFFLMLNRGFHDFPSSFYCISGEKYRRGTRLCFKSFLIWQKF